MRRMFGQPGLPRLLLGLVGLLAALASAQPARAAATVTVTTTNDVVANDGVCSLREAIQATNADASVNDCLHDGSGGTDTIAFNIPGALSTIQVAGALPAITGPVVIDGSTDPDFPGTPNVAVDGILAGAGVNGFVFQAAGGTLRGLVVQNFSLAGVRADADDTAIEGSYIGTNFAGTLANANLLGIVVTGDDVRIGGGTAARRNLISGNARNGIRAEASASGLVVQGNAIGVNAAGTAALANGSGAVPPNEAGILMFGTGGTFGGSAAGQGNLISGNAGAGINFQAGANNNTVRGNVVGLNAAGSSAVFNGNDGILVNGASGITIGGTDGTTPGGACTGSCNLISGNQDTGITVSGASPNTLIVGNVVGLDRSGAVAVPNQTDGIVLFGANGAIVGSESDSLGRNVISGNLFTGITIRATGRNNAIVGNYIGTNAAGTATRANGQGGVALIEGSADNRVGGSAGLTAGGACTGACNLIFGNNGRGVSISGAGATGNRVLGNSIDANLGIGIDLGANTVTANDAGDADAGPNDLQNFPVLTSATTGGGVTQVVGSLASTAGTNGFRVELFSSPACDGSGNGEGRVFLGGVTVNTDAAGNAAINAAGLPATTVGHVVTATATSPTNNTSEFSACLTIAAAAASGIAVNPASGLQTTEAGGTARFTVVLSGAPTADVTIGLSSSDTTEGTVSPAALTFTPANALVPQVVTVTGVDDALLDNSVGYSIVTAPAASADPAYNGVDASDVGVINLDDDAPGTVIVSPTSGLRTTEAGGTARFTVVLSGAPTADVTIGLSSSDTTEGTVGPAALTFTPADGLVPQVVSVTGVDDAVLDGNVAYTVVTAPAASADPAYNGVNGADVGLTNLDDEAPAPPPPPARGGIAVSAVPPSRTTEAGGTARFAVVLTTVPTADVTIGLSSSDTTEGTVGPAALTFTPANGLVPQVVTVTGVDDAVLDGDVAYQIVFAAATSADPAYSGLDPVDPTVVNVDDDVVSEPPAANDPNRDEEIRLTELEIRQRERTNRGGPDDDRTEGNVVEVDDAASPPTATIANRDGLQVVVLGCKGGCGRVRVGDYLEADGAKEHEQLFYAEAIKATRPR